MFAQRRARQKLAGDGPGGHVLVGKRESGDGGRTTRSTRMCVAPDGKRNQWDMGEVLVTY